MFNLQCPISNGYLIDRREIGRNGIAGGIACKVQRGQVMPDFAQRVGVNGADSGKIERFQQNLLQRPDCPRRPDHRRNGDQNCLRWDGVGLIVLQRDAGGFGRVRHDFYPFVYEQPGKRLALTRTALDIEAAGVDRDSGAGIVDAFAALQFIAEPAPLLEFGTVVTTAVGDDGDNVVEPGEGGTLMVALTNVGGATALGVSATLTSSTPGVTITSATSNYPNISSNGQSANNVTPFAFTLANAAPCGVAIDFTLTVNVANSNEGPQTFAFKVQTVGANTTVISYPGPPAPIFSLINIPIVVSGLSAPIDDLNFSFDGSTCTNAPFATTVGLDSVFVGDLIVTLTSPQGTTVTLMNQPGGFLNVGRNFCNTVLDDSATALIQAITPDGAPYTGAFRPASPLAAFNFNNIFSSGGMACGGTCADRTGTDGNISADLLFTNSTQGDYHLQQGSPSIDSGSNLAPDLPDTDVDGDPRILDGDGNGTTIVDMGIDEFLALTSFNIRLQDKSNGNMLKINSTNGQYLFYSMRGNHPWRHRKSDRERQFGYFPGPRR
jgi:hypothetical protein